MIINGLCFEQEELMKELKKISTTNYIIINSLKFLKSYFFGVYFKYQLFFYLYIG